MAEWMIPAVIKPQQDEVTAVLALTTFGERIETLHINPGISQMPQGSS